MNNRKTVRIAPELWRELKAQAIREEMTIGRFIEMIFNKWCVSRLSSGQRYDAKGE